MEISYSKRAYIRSVPHSSEHRRKTDWSKLSNNDLKFAYDLLALHESPWEVDAMNEIEKRITSGNWVDLENPPPPLENMPEWLKMYPFRLFWKQGRVKQGSGEKRIHQDGHEVCLCGKPFGHEA
jgi:hypothetical protein